jgi:hypothetical protein
MMSREEYAGIPGIDDEKPSESGQELPKGNRGLFVWEPFCGRTTKENNRDAQNTEPQDKYRIQHYPFGWFRLKITLQCTHREYSHIHNFRSTLKSLLSADSH